MNEFDHETLDVSVAAIDVVALADEVVERRPRGRGSLADQRQRAATSIVLTIAEGAGECSTNGKARFYRIAKRSATESAAILHVCDRLTLVDPARYHAGHELLLRLVARRVQMVRRIAGTGTGTK